MAELFAKFEVNKSPWWPRVAHLVGGSCALHLVLTACVLYIPGLRSAFNLAGAFQGVGFVNEDYERTAIGERAQILEFPHERFQYPEGYFNNGEQTPSPFLAQNGTPVIVQQYTPPAPLRLPRYRAPRPLPLPKATPDASPTPQASPGPSAPNNSTVAGKDNKPEEKKSPQDIENDKKLDQIAEQNGIARPKPINKKPFIDWLAEAKKRKDSGAIDLNGEIEIVAEAEGIGPDGKLVEAEVTPKSGDPNLYEPAKQLVQAVSDSGALSFLGGTGHISMTFKMDGTDISVSITTEMTSEAEATKKAEGYSSLLSASSIFKVGGEEAAAIYKNTKVSSNGKQIILSFTMPRQTAGDMLKKQIPTG
jgi:hypothetical protein